jgi:hypothetical protein
MERYLQMDSRHSKELRNKKQNETIYKMPLAEIIACHSFFPALFFFSFFLLLGRFKRMKKIEGSRAFGTNPAFEIYNLTVV